MPKTTPRWTPHQHTPPIHATTQSPVSFLSSPSLLRVVSRSQSSHNRSMPDTGLRKVPPIRSPFTSTPHFPSTTLAAPCCTPCSLLRYLVLADIPELWVSQVAMNRSRSTCSSLLRSSAAGGGGSDGGGREGSVVEGCGADRSRDVRGCVMGAGVGQDGERDGAPLGCRRVACWSQKPGWEFES